MTEYLEPEELEPQFQANRSFLDELVAWREQFGMAPGSAADRCAAYLIRRAFEDHAVGWREEAGRLRHDLGASARPPLVLAIRATERLLQHLAAEPSTPEILGSTRQHQAWLATYRRALDQGEDVEVHGIRDEHLPDWYFLAQAHNAWFREAYPGRV